jgi:hypothetical protein
MKCVASDVPDTARQSGGCLSVQDGDIQDD